MSMRPTDFKVNIIISRVEHASLDELRERQGLRTGADLWRRAMNHYLQHHQHGVPLLEIRGQGRPKKTRTAKEPRQPRAPQAVKVRGSRYAGHPSVKSPWELLSYD